MATATKGKKSYCRKRRERKNIEKGAGAYPVPTFNNTMVTMTDMRRQRPVLGLLRRPGLPRFPKVHPLRRADRRRDRCQGRHGARPEDRRGVREGPRRRP